MFGLGLTSNIMSLGGIAIAIGAMVDSAIIMVENAHKFLEHFREEQGREPNSTERVATCHRRGQKRRAPALFLAPRHHGQLHSGLLAQAQEGRLFKPLAFTKTFSMFFAALLGITLVPVLMLCSSAGKSRRKPGTRSTGF